MSKEYRYKIAWCSVCNQGWIEFVKEVSSGELFLCCDECEAEWENPEDVNETGKGTRFKYGKVIEPSLEEIQAKGWERYIVKE